MMASMSSNSTSLATVVHFIGSRAPLLSGGLDECHNATDETCSGGVAAVELLARYLVGPEEPYLILNPIDKASAFSQMHPAVSDEDGVWCD